MLLLDLLYFDYRRSLELVAAFFQDQEQWITVFTYKADFLLYQFFLQYQQKRNDGLRLKRMVSQHFRKIAISLLSSELTGRNQSRLKSAGTDVLPGCLIVFDRNACWDSF